MIFRALCLSALLASGARAASDVEIDWRLPLRVARTTPTLQVVVNPLLRRGSPVHDPAFRALRGLGARYVRFVPWLPYPRLAVSELKAPSATGTSWDFSLIDPLVEDFFESTAGRSSVLNFSTIPQWMFKTDWDVGYPDDPDEVSWGYEQGTELRDPSLQELGDYYARVVSWYTRGGFADELGVRRESGHFYPLRFWEVLNEPDNEHQTTAAEYTARYDAIVGAIRKVAPEIRFTGLALMAPTLLIPYFEYFLNPVHHTSGTPIDWISYHFYALKKDPTASIDEQASSYFAQSDAFLDSVRAIDSIRQRMSPATRTAINEVGTMAEDAALSGQNLTPLYWNLSGAIYAYLFARLAQLGIDVVGESQLVAYPSQFPSVSMIDWQTGHPNARYWTLKLLLESYAAGDRIYAAQWTGDPSVFAMGIRRRDGTRRLLLVNRGDLELPVNLGQAGWRSARTVAPSTGEGPPAAVKLLRGRLGLEPFSVTVVSEE